MNMEDARVKRTRTAIRENFLALLREKPVSRITVKEICERCQINRTTFYKHYSDPLDVLEKMEGEILDSLEGSFPAAFEDMASFLDRVLARIEENVADYLVLASPNGDPSLHAKVFQRCYQAVFPRLEGHFEGLSPALRDMAYQYLAQGSGGILSAWIRGGMTEPRENVAALLLRMNSAGQSRGEDAHGAARAAGGL